MDDTWIIMVFVVFDELCHTFLEGPKRVRARRWRKVRGREDWGYCPARK